MRAITFLIVAILGLNIQIAVSQEKMDTIIKVEGKVQPCNVTHVTTNYVKFVVPGSEEVFTYKRSEIHKIIYKNGRIDEFNAPAMIMIDENSWQAVWFTKKKQDVAGMYNLGEVKAHSPPSARSPKAAKKSATILLQKSCARKKGQVVLIKEQRSTGGYGEHPGYFFRGDAYGYEPVDENGKVQKNTAVN